MDAESQPFRGDTEIMLLRKIVTLLGGTADAFDTEQVLLYKWAKLVCDC